MEKEKDREDYIFQLKRNIDNYIYNMEFRKAFALLIMFLERLDTNEKTQVIDYYSKNMQDYGIFRSGFAIG